MPLSTQRGAAAIPIIYIRCRDGAALVCFFQPANRASTPVEYWSIPTRVLEYPHESTGVSPREYCDVPAAGTDMWPKNWPFAFHCLNLHIVWPGARGAENGFLTPAVTNRAIIILNHSIHDIGRKNGKLYLLWKR